MRCNAWSAYGWSSQKSLDRGARGKKLGTMSDEHIAALFGEYSDYAISVGEAVIGELVQCPGGQIIAHVLAAEEPYLGGTNAELRVSYRCKECGHSYYPELPDAYNISEFLTEAIERM